ncbi:hypothetical protein M404DRAFT_157900 [Pisolithus tinctorius Marx 270]|uniref:Uncharacterized protein n=1 Tax=Pisolithus tinctorius Marx 270 TaxID=870435 RepID=A0A0C3MV80_PISTI|nr:hypothetical protein M404DRAFT_172524 [Pisolithus tinctorius Marx 270]KIN98362.1 hypothetical protein M404DRAFT_157900 [Pisolithus tinctorius Marx 270]
MPPVAESLEDSQQLLVVGIIVEFWRSHGARVESDWAEFTVGAGDQQNASNGIVGGVGFHCKQSIKNPVSENRSAAEGILQVEESGAALLRNVPRSTLSREVSEQNDDVGVVINESSVEVCKTKERLDVSHLLWLRPVADCLNLLSRLGETGGRKNITEVLDGVRVKLALLQLGIKAMLSKAVEYLFYVFAMRLHHVCKDAIDESLESRRCVSQTEWHHLPLVRTIMSAESRFPLITVCYADQMIGMVEIDLGVDFSVAWRIE